jgi:cytochrome c2
MTRRIGFIVCVAAALSIAGCNATQGDLFGGQASGAQRSVPELMVQYGCPTCHVIPHVPGAVGKVGPPLMAISRRSYLAGVLPNTPENLERWIMHPQHYEPGNAMPEMGVSQQDAHLIAEFLDSQP